MNDRTRKLALAAGGTVGALVLYLVADAAYFSPRAEKLAQLDALRASIVSLDEKMEDDLAARKRLKDVGARTLGSRFDAVEHKFRTGLSRLAERAGLAQIRVDSDPAEAIANPLLTNTRVTNVRSALRRAPRDFNVIRGSLRGVGTLEQALRTLAAVEAQPWVHRVASVQIRPIGPADQPAERFEFRVTALTLFVPDLAPAGPEDEVKLADASAGSELLLGPILSRNPFREPAPPPPAVTVAQTSPAPAQNAQPEQPPAPPPPPYAEWRLVGVMLGSRGPEALMVNARTREAITMTRGMQLLDATMLDAEGERAVFEIRGQRFELTTGATLSQRRPISN
ncbi:MAG: hypothetical protein SFY95_05310 [Planctomycetota bacterium]|nr:hypothetical protein [Planctomycetota bacterium]